MSAKVIRMRHRRPRVYTSSEQLIERMREEIFKSGRPYRQIAADCGVSEATIRKLAQGYTKWPRPTTFFPLLNALGKALDVVDR